MLDELFLIIFAAASHSNSNSQLIACGKMISGAALLAICPTLALRTPLVVPTNNSFCLITASFSTSSMYVPMRKTTSASRIDLGSLNNSKSFSLTQSQTVFTL